MSLHAPRLLSVALTMLGVVLAGCGHRQQSPSTEAALRSDVTKALTSTDKDDCKLSSYATKRFADQMSFSISELVDETERNCRAYVGDYAATSVQLTRVKVDGDRATARLVATGGQYAYGGFDADFVRDGVWKLDALTRVDVDRHKFERLLFGLPTVGGETQTKTQENCTIRRLRRYSDAELGTAIVRSDIQLVLDPVLVCFLRPELRDSGLSDDETGCVLRRLRAEGRALLKLTARRDEKATEKLFRAAGQQCAQQGVTV